MDFRTAAVVEPDDLIKLPDGDHYELLDGRPVEKVMGAKADEIGGILVTLLNNFIRPRSLGRAYPSQTGYQCFPDRPKHVRLPDVSFVASGRLPDDRSPDGYIKIAPDLAIEVVSPNDLCEELEEKIQDYRQAKVPLIWIVYPGSKIVLIRRADGSCAEVGATGELSGETVIAGFTCKVAELFV